MEQAERKPLFDTFDWLIGIGAVPFQEPLIFVVAGLIILVRHWPRMASGFLQLAGVRVVRPWHCKVLPGAAMYLGPESVKNNEPVMSNEPQNHPGSDGAGTGSADPVPPQQHQAEPVLVLDFDAVLAYLNRHKLTDEQAIDLFTAAQRESGYLLSANKIREVVGGNEAAVKARVARGRPRPVVAAPAASLKRPQEGW